MTPALHAQAPPRRYRLAAKIAVFFGILVLLNYAIGWLADLFAFQMWPRHVHAASFLLRGALP